jgi:hypothetical protein
VSQRLFLLAAGGVLFWAATALPVWLLGGGDLVLLHSGTAGLLCLLPALLTLAWAEWTSRKDPRQVPLVILGGTCVRLFGVLIAGFLLLQTVPLYREQDGFLIWLLVFYLFTLALEMTLLLKARPHPDGSAGADRG